MFLEGSKRDTLVQHHCRRGRVLCKQCGHFLDVVPCGGESALWPRAIGIDVAYQEWISECRKVIGNQNST